jgi:hypothetical protein
VVMPAAGTAAVDTVARSLAPGRGVGVRSPGSRRAPGRGYHTSHLGGRPRGADSRGTQVPRGAGAGAAPEVVVQPGHQCPPRAEALLQDSAGTSQRQVRLQETKAGRPARPSARRPHGSCLVRAPKPRAAATPDPAAYLPKGVRPLSESEGASAT